MGKIIHTQPKLNPDGSRYIDPITNDFVNEIIEIIDDGEPIEISPNWLGLEQDLRYSTMFEKAFSQANEKGFNLFTVTLVNGKSGHASENALRFAFEMLGVNWTEEEKIAINQILENNYFITRLDLSSSRVFFKQEGNEKDKKVINNQNNKLSLWYKLLLFIKKIFKL